MDECLLCNDVEIVGTFSSYLNVHRWKMASILTMDPLMVISYLMVTICYILSRWVMTKPPIALTILIPTCMSSTTTSMM
jgi:hypothetical protein